VRLKVSVEIFLPLIVISTFYAVIPAKAGTHFHSSSGAYAKMDPRLRGEDNMEVLQGSQYFNSP
jgi:hypothetical protein